MKQYTKGMANQRTGFKSDLECIVGLWLHDALGMDVHYEPETFYIKSLKRNYTPDFVNENTHQYFEAKPSLEFADIKLYEQFCKQEQKELVVITTKDIMIINLWGDGSADTARTDGEDIVKITFCSHCRNKSFTTIYGSYQCRSCKLHNGDGDSYYYPDNFPSECNGGYLPAPFEKFYCFVIKNKSSFGIVR